MKTYYESDILAAIKDTLTDVEIQYGSRTDPYGVGLHEGACESLYALLDRFNIDTDNEFED